MNGTPSISYYPNRVDITMRLRPLHRVPYFPSQRSDGHVVVENPKSNKTRNSRKHCSVVLVVLALTQRHKSSPRSQDRLKQNSGVEKYLSRKKRKTSAPAWMTELTACLSACALRAALRELLILGRWRRLPVRVHTYPFSLAYLFSSFIINAGCSGGGENGRLHRIFLTFRPSSVPVKAEGTGGRGGVLIS